MPKARANPKSASFSSPFCAETQMADYTNADQHTGFGRAFDAHRYQSLCSSVGSKITLTLLMSRFCGFRSRWRTFRLWQKARPFSSWYMKDCRRRRQTNKMWQPEGHHLPIKLSNIGCICIWLNLSPSQFQDPDPHCSCQNTSSNPAGDKRHDKSHVKSTCTTYCMLGTSISPDHNIQTPGWASCRCAGHRVVWRRQSSFKCWRPGWIRTLIRHNNLRSADWPDNVFMLQFLQKADFSQSRTWHPLEKWHPAGVSTSLLTTASIRFNEY